MPSKHKTPLLGWHPTSAEDASWVREEAKRRGVNLKVVLDEMLADYRKRNDVSAKGDEGDRRAG